MGLGYSARYGVPGLSLERKMRYSRESTMFSKQSAPLYWPITTKLTRFVECWHWVPDVEFQENLWNGSGNVVEKFLCSASHVPFIVDQSCPNLQRFVGHGCSVLDMEFHENPWNWGLDTEEKVLCSPSTVPFIICWLCPDLHVCWGTGVEFYLRSFRKIPWMEDKIQLRRFFVLLVKCCSLLTKRDQTYVFCRAWE